MRFCSVLLFYFEIAGSRNGGWFLLCHREEALSRMRLLLEVLFWIADKTQPKVFCFAAVEFISCPQHAKLLCCLHLEPTPFLYPFFIFQGWSSQLCSDSSFPLDKLLLSCCLYRRGGAAQATLMSPTLECICLSQCEQKQHLEVSLLLFKPDQCLIHGKPVCSLQSRVRQKKSKFLFAYKIDSRS